MAFKCPACDRPLYNRRRADCEFCGAVIPPALLFSPSQVATIERMKQQQQVRERELRESERSRNSDGGRLGSFGGGDVLRDLGNGIF